MRKGRGEGVFDKIKFNGMYDARNGTPFVQNGSITLAGSPIDMKGRKLDGSKAFDWW